jgi:hypothetical protein
MLFIYITRLATNEIFSPSNKIHREVGQVKDLSAFSTSVRVCDDHHVFCCAIVYFCLYFDPIYQFLQNLVGPYANEGLHNFIITSNL